MKKQKLQLVLIIFTFLSLIALIGIQVSWIFKTARLQEQQFSNNVEMAIHRIVEKMALDKQVCSEVASCMGGEGMISCYQQMYNQSEWQVVDSIINCALNSYNIDLDYEFDIVDINTDSDYQVCPKSYFSHNLESVLLRNGVELKIRFPNKSEFILAQIGSLFISSILLIILISLSFIVILKYYRREKNLYHSTRDFINNMTHEFKTPLTNISLANSMMLKNDSVIKDEKLNQYADIIRKEHKKLKYRVEGLLDAARIENGQELACETINICNIIQCVVDSYQVQLQELDGEITYDKKSEACTINADKEQFQFVISNLIDNAIKYCEREPKVKISSYTKANHVTIEIEDNGIGIKKEHLKQIFEKFYRIPTGDVHNVKGFGIGLSTVKAIIDTMDGKIEVQSTPGKGSKFSIKLNYCEG